MPALHDDDQDDVARGVAPTCGLQLATHPSSSAAILNMSALTSTALVPTLLPARVAELITNLAMSTRLTLRCVAWAVEIMLESTQQSTRLSLTLTRQILVSAISSARRAYLLSNSALSMTGLVSSCTPGAAEQSNDDDPFFQVLDKYTNIGIYIIHHTFTMAELFAMSGFYLTTSAVQNAHFAAQESVAMFDTLFGSNESSRALSSFITLVRRELLEDERFKAKDQGKLASLAALTKTLTAFACLQCATWKSTENRFKLSYLYDCTLLEESESSDGTASPRFRAIDNLAGPAGILQLPASQTSLGHLSPYEMGPADNFGRPSPSSSPELSSGSLLPSVLQPGNRGRSSSSSTFKSSRPVSMDYQDLADLKQLLSDPDSPRAHPKEPTTPSRPRLRSCGRNMDRQDDEAEITTDYMESMITSQMLKAQYWITDSPSQTNEEADDWITLNPPDWNVDSVAFPSAPNGTPAAPSRTFREALGHPHDHVENIQYVLKTMTRRVMRRRQSLKFSNTEKELNFEDGVDMTEESQSDETIRRAEEDHASDDSFSFSPKAPRSEREALGRPAAPSAFKGISFRDRMSSFFGRKQEGSHTNVIPSSSHIGTFSPPCPAADTTGAPGSPDRSAIARHAPKASAARRRQTKGSQRDDARHPAMTSRTRVDSRFFTVQVKQAQIYSHKQGTQLYPHEPLVKNIHRFMRYSSAAYGQSFLRIMGFGENEEYSFHSTARHHANSWAFAHHANIPVDDILLSSYVDSTPLSSNEPPLVHFVAIEHSIRAVVLTCRGTLGLSDILIDLTCDYRKIHVPCGRLDAEYCVHSGMYQSALQLVAQRSTVHQTLVKALEEHPTYGLVLCGHSLGGGVAALLAIVSAMPTVTFLKENSQRACPVRHHEIKTKFVTAFSSGLPAGRPIHCYAYGPSAVASPDLVRYAEGLVTSVVQNTDIVPCLSLGVLRDLKNIAVSLYDEPNVAEEIVGRVIGLRQRPFGLSTDERVRLDDSHALNEWMTSLIKTMRADMDNPKLYPPGDVYVMDHYEVFVSSAMTASEKAEPNIKAQRADRVTLRKCDTVEERFREREFHSESVKDRRADEEAIFSKSMLHDHLPTNYERSTKLLYDAFLATETPSGRQTAP